MGTQIPAAFTEEIPDLNLPTQDYRRTRIVMPDKLHQGLDRMVYGMVGSYHRRRGIGRDLRSQAEKIAEMAGEFRNVSDRRLRERLQDLKAMFYRRAAGYESLIPKALAAMVEVSHRTLGLRPYPVQIMGALALNDGYLAEMATGEGKSLTACLPAVLAAWSGRPSHFVTVNDYLANRDAEEMRPFYHYCGVSAGCVMGEMDPKARRENYDKDFVYTTLKELVADFLRDRLILGAFHHPSRRLLKQLLLPQQRDQAGLVLRGLDTVIVDEADSVLIDEAVTPLIISRPQENRPLIEACQAVHNITESLKPGEDYRVDIKYKEINLTKDGFSKVKEQSRHFPGIWRGAERWQELVQQSLTAREFYKLDKQYVIQDGKVTIVDEFTGRLMPNRTWRHGLHQAVEAKEGLAVNDPSETLARLSFQQFFRFFRRLSGMTGTAKEARSEFWHIYGLSVITIPTHRPCIRKLSPDAVFSSAEDKWRAIVEEIVRCRQTARPVLVGTRSVRASEKLAGMLSERGLEYNLLNAVRHREEAQIVAAAGEQSRITIATNMAGRGTDIKLGRRVADLGGLHVIATERHESGRIDRQLFGRCARQGDPGSAQAFMCLDDELIQRFVPAWMHQRLKSAIASNAPGTRQLAQIAISRAQKAAQRLAFRQRHNVLRMDTWLEEALAFSGSGLRF
jgi:preprotein translocase subunit SecA